MAITGRWRKFDHERDGQLMMEQVTEGLMSTRCVDRTSTVGGPAPARPVPNIANLGDDAQKKVDTYR